MEGDVKVISKDGRSVHARLSPTGSEFVSFWTDGNKSLGCVVVSAAVGWLEQGHLTQGIELDAEACALLLDYLHGVVRAAAPGPRLRESDLSERLLACSL